jgi:replicative DNA helicase
MIVGAHSAEQSVASLYTKKRESGFMMTSRGNLIVPAYRKKEEIERMRRAGYIYMPYCDLFNRDFDSLTQELKCSDSRCSGDCDNCDHAVFTEMVTQDEINRLLSGEGESTDYTARLIRSALDRIKNKREKKPTGIYTGFDEIDWMLSGIQPSDLVIVAARQSMGKSAFLLHLLRKITLHENGSALFFSFDMTGEECITRMIAQETHTDFGLLGMGHIDEEDWEKISDCADEIETSDLIIEDFDVSIYSISSRCRKYIRNHDLKIIMIDYLQLLNGRKSQVYNSRREELSGIVRALKDLAREIKVPILLTSQLPAEIDDRPDKRPVLSELAGYGDLVQYADKIMFIYRDAYYYRDTENRETAEFIVAKNRNGAVGTGKLKWIPSYGGYEEMIST